MPSAGEGEVLLRTRYISLDAANRAWMQGATYRSALEGGQVMAGGALAEVVQSNVGHLKPGDTIECLIVNNGSNVLTLVVGSGMSFDTGGNGTIPANNSKFVNFRFTGVTPGAETIVLYS